MTTHEVQAIGPRKIIVQLTRAVTYLVYFYLIAVEIILLLGFFLLLFGANSSASFTQWAYRNLDRVMEPFRGIFAPIELGTTSADVQAVFDTAVLFAMIVYGIIAIVHELADHMADRSTAVSRGGRSRCRVSPGARSTGCRGASTWACRRRDDLPPGSGRSADCGDRPIQTRQLRGSRSETVRPAGQPAAWFTQNATPKPNTVAIPAQRRAC